VALLDNFMFKPRPGVPFLTPAEKVLFQRLRRGGALSVFRCVACEHCKTEIPKPKRFCSERCFKIWTAAHTIADAIHDGLNGEDE